MPGCGPQQGKSGDRVLGLRFNEEDRTPNGLTAEQFLEGYSTKRALMLCSYD